MDFKMEDEMKEGLKIIEWLWTSPDLPTLKRLMLFWIYIPYLIYSFVRGTPVLIGVWEQEDSKPWEKKNYIDYRDIERPTYKKSLSQCEYCREWKTPCEMEPIVLIEKDIKNTAEFHKQSCKLCTKKFRS